MMAGAVCGFAGSEMPLTELSVALSVVLLGFAIAWRQSSDYPRLVFAFVALFGLCHG
jgi:urease accessory protein